MTRNREPRRPLPRAVKEPSPAESVPAGGATARAKLFWNGRSQAVRLPKEFRFEGREVAIRRQGERVILEPLRKKGWPKGYWERLHELAKDLEFPDVGPLPPGGTSVDLDRR